MVLFHSQIIIRTFARDYETCVIGVDLPDGLLVMYEGR